MTPPLTVALLGNIPKGDTARKNWKDWKISFQKHINRAFPEARFVHGDTISDNAGPELVVGHDVWQIQHADIVIVNATEKIGAGTAQEMVLAKYYRKPVVTVLPKNTHHRRSGVVFDGIMVDDWIHPFLVVTSDYIAENLEQAVRWLQQYLRNRNMVNIKDITVFDQAVAKFDATKPEIRQ